jgi:hypothetical protein
MNIALTRELEPRVGYFFQQSQLALQSEPNYGMCLFLLIMTNIGHPGDGYLLEHNYSQNEQHPRLHYFGDDLFICVLKCYNTMSINNSLSCGACVSS